MERKTILLVEDQALLAMTEAETITQFGYDVIIAHSGEKAVELAVGNQTISLILMDIDLGRGIDGPEAATQILSKRTVPIVFLTSHSEREMVEKVRDITRYGYVIKDSGEFVLASSIEMAFELFSAHEKVLEREEKYRSLFDNAVEGIFQTTPEGKFLSANPALARLFGYDSPQELMEQTIDIGSQCYARAEDREMFLKVLGREGAIREFDTQLIKRDGNPRWVSINARAVKNDEGSVIYYEGSVEDITERTRMEEALKESHEIFSQFMEHSPIYVFFKDEYARPVRLSRNYEAMLGRPLHELIGKTMNDLFPSDLARSMVEDDLKVLREGKPIVVNEEYDGRFYATTKFPVLRPGKPPFLAGYTIDVTGQKKTEENLKRINERFHLATHAARMGVWDWDIGKNELVWDDKMYELYGLEREAFAGAYEAWLQGVHRDDRAMSDEISKQAVSGEKEYDTEFRIVWPDGAVRLLRAHGMITRDGEGNPLRMIGVNYDITEHRQAEDALRESEERYSRTLAVVNDGLWDWNIPTGDAFFSALYYAILGYDDKEFTASYDSWRMLVHPEDIGRVEQDLQESLERVSGFSIDLRMKMKSGEWRWVSTRGKAIELDADGKALRMIGTLSDITDRKLAEEQIKSLLAEKELLLREVHHRIKNNMNVVGSLLALQARRLKDPSAVSVLKDAGSRVRSMMVLYDKLYRSADYRSISAKEYLTSLIEEIAGHFPNRDVVRIETEIDDWMLDAKTLSPLGIILNELLTNTMKHAFVGRDGGVITVCFSIEETHAKLSIEDNGTGIPESVDIANSSGFGLHLVSILTDQLEGTIRVERHEGTRVVLEFEK